MLVSKIEIKMQFPYDDMAQYEHRTAADTHLQYHCAWELKYYIAIYVAQWFVPWDTNIPHGRQNCVVIYY